MSTSPPIVALRRQQGRREQGVPTLTALAGPVGLGVRAWGVWAGADRRPCVVAARPDSADVLADWVRAAFGAANPVERACRWLAAITARDAESLAGEVARMTCYDLDTRWRELPVDPHAPVAAAALLVLSDRAAGLVTDPARFVRELAGAAGGPGRVIQAVAGLFPPEVWPALLLVPAPGDVASAVRLLESLATAEARLPVAVALAADEHRQFTARQPDTRAAALLREGFVEVRGVSGNELAEKLRAAGVEPPTASVNRLAADGVADEVAAAFVDAARAVRAPTPADAASDFRSVSEEFLFGQLQSMPRTAGLFRPNRPLGFRHGRQPAEADLLAESLKLVVEVDGAHFHLTAEQYRRDRRKDWLYQRHGYLVLRFLAEDVVADLELVLNTILEAVELRRASALPTGAA